MAFPAFDLPGNLLPFEKLKFSVKACLEQDSTSDVLSHIASLCSDINNSGDNDKKTAIDQAFKEVLMEKVIEDGGTEPITSFLELAVEAVQNDFCSASSPFVMLADVFDTVTIDICEKLFSFVERKVTVWKMDIFYNAGKNYLLRMCNDLLRRLSRSQHTIFCGRIQLFLARLFPLTEKSGLNLMSQFNLENVTVFTTKVEDYESGRRTSESQKDEPVEMEEGEMEESVSTIPIDYNLYKKFWSLQDFFRRPQQCYEKTSWTTFSLNSDEVLSCFLSYKLEDMKGAKRKVETVQRQKPVTFFTKYLTSEKLLDLQLSDGNFRRYVLIQFLILFQYLNAPVRFKTNTQSLSEEQSTWVKDTHSKVMTLLKETPPDGENFATAIEHILSREENWNNWKNEGCQSYVRSSNPDTSNMPERSRKRTFGDDVKETQGKSMKMGSAELTKLWNLQPDNMAACTNEKGDTMPKLDVFFEEAIEQMDPEAQVDEEYRLINNPSFAWKALRVLARKNGHFFCQQPPPPGAPGTVRTQKEYLALMLQKMEKEIMPSSSSLAEAETEKTELEEEENEKLGSPGSPEKDKSSAGAPAAGSAQDKGVNKAQLEQIAAVLGDTWKKLAAGLKTDEDVIAYIEAEKTQTKSKALKFLTLWQENEGANATPAALTDALTAIGKAAVAQRVFK